jgi:hypothetical protein
LIEADIKKALEGPYKQKLIAYAKKLNELKDMEEE